jgi:hypothetical protein
LVRDQGSLDDDWFEIKGVLMVRNQGSLDDDWFVIKGVLMMIDSKSREMEQGRDEVLKVVL